MAGQPINLTLAGAALDADAVAQLAFSLARDVEAETGIATARPEGATAPGAKGDPVTLGAIVLAAVSSGGAVAALFGVLKSYIERQPSLEFTMTRADGGSIKIAAKDVTPANLDATYRLAERFYGLGDK